MAEEVISFHERKNKMNKTMKVSRLAAWVLTVLVAGVGVDGFGRTTFVWNLNGSDGWRGYSAEVT